MNSEILCTCMSSPYAGDSHACPTIAGQVSGPGEGRSSGAQMRWSPLTGRGQAPGSGTGVNMAVRGSWSFEASNRPPQGSGSGGSQSGGGYSQPYGQPQQTLGRSLGRHHLEDDELYFDTQPSQCSPTGASGLESGNRFIDLSSDVQDRSQEWEANAEECVGDIEVNVGLGFNPVFF